MSPMLTLAILAGGKSDRMGRDKALLPFLGRPLIQHILDQLAPIADEILISANAPADYAFLNLPVHVDLQAGAGPLGGLYTALKAAKNPLVAAVACDMPFASRTLLEYELDLIVKTEADVVIPATARGLEPLHAIYLRENCLPAIEAALQEKSFKLTDWLAKVHTRLVPAEVVLQFDPQGAGIPQPEHAGGTGAG